MRTSTVIVVAAVTALLAGAFGQTAHALGASPTPAQDGGVGTSVASPSGPPTRGRPEALAAPAGDFDTPRAPTWWGFRELDGRAMRWDNITKGPRAGQRVLRVVIGKQYLLKGQVPGRYRSSLAGQRLVLQARADTGGSWKSVTSARVGMNGRFKVAFDIPRRLQWVHQYRLTVPRVARTTTQGTVLPGPTLTASGDVSWSVIFVNDGGDDLYLNFPGGQDPSNGYYSFGTWALPDNTASQLTWVNPIEDQTTFSFVVNKLECFMGCNNFYANWNYGQGRYEACSEAMPDFTSGSTWTVRITGQDLDAGYDMFLLDDSGSVVCTGSLDTKFDNWLINHPVAKWVAITIAAAAAVALVVVAWEGIAAVLALIEEAQAGLEGVELVEERGQYYVENGVPVEVLDWDD